MPRSCCDRHARWLERPARPPLRALQTSSSILEHLGEIEALAPGLYEMKIDNPTGDPDCERDQYAVRFEPRRIEDVRFDYSVHAFERARQVSEWNERAYRTIVSPWVKAVANPWLSASLQWLHPLRSSRYLWSERFLPWMGAYAVLAAAVSRNRHALAEDHPLLVQERRLIAQISAFWEAARKVRDAAQERGLHHALWRLECPPFFTRFSAVSFGTEVSRSRDRPVNGSRSGTTPGDRSRCASWTRLPNAS